MRTIYLALICSALLSLESTAQSVASNSKTESQIDIYHRYLDMALNNWCVFFDNTGLDPIAYNSESADILTGENYSKSLHKKLLFAALKCEYGTKRLSYIDALIDQELVTNKEKKNLLTYAFVYTFNNKEINGSHSKYKKSLDKLLAEEEFKVLEKKTKGPYGELLSFDQIFQP